MNTIMWHKKRLFIIVIISVATFMLFKKRNYMFSVETLLPKTKAETVWEFSADFSNVKKYLVPYIENFNILSESGNYDHWKYSVAYSEPLPVWPYFDSTGTGHYSVTTDGEKYIISSKQDTCFFNGLVCSESRCVFEMKQINQRDTLYREDIVYQCPSILKSWCGYMVDYTRDLYIKNLKKYFQITN